MLVYFSILVLLLTTVTEYCSAEATSTSAVVCSGSITEVAFRGDPAKNLILSSNYSDFKVTIAIDGRYLVNISEPDGVERYDSFDGTDTYCLEYWNSKVTTEKAIPLAFISHGCFPYDNRVIIAGVLWTVFGSGTFFHTNTSSAAYPLPFRMARLDASVYGFRYDAQIEGREPFLPTTIVYYRDTNSDLSLENPLANSELDAITDPNDLDKYKKQIAWLKKRYDKNDFRAVDLISDNFTNVGGIAIPKTFTVRAFNPKWEDTPTIIVSGQVFTTDAVIINSGFQPPIKAQIEVVDNRFRWRNGASTIDGIVYPMNSKVTWRNATDPYLVNMFQQEGKFPQTIMTFSVKKSVIICVLLFVFTAFPVWLVWRHPHRKAESK
jgi:hypothetical protein